MYHLIKLPMRAVSPADCGLGAKRSLDDSEYFSVVARGSIPPSSLSYAFFSAQNIKKVQNLLRYETYRLSDDNAVIGDQSEEELVIVMRGMFIQYSKNQTFNIPGQIAELNSLVVEQMVPKILSEVAGHVLYLKDRFLGLTPIPQPVNVNCAGLAQNRGFADALMGAPRNQ